MIEGMTARVSISTDKIAWGSVRAALGESPVWDARRRSWFWTDIPGGTLHAMSLDGVARQWDLGAPLAFAVMHAGGGLVIGRGCELLHFDPDTSRPEPLLQVTEPRSFLRLNDAVCDSAGRLWAGTMSTQPNDLSSGALFRVSADGACECIADGLGVPNGPCLSPDERWFYLADSRRFRIVRYSYDAGGGTLGDSTIFVKTTPPAKPDGAAVDTDGCVWTCEWDGGSVVRYDPDGREFARIRLPVARPASCAFGGDDMRTLFVTTAQGGAPEGGQSLAGHVCWFNVPAPVTGLSPSAAALHRPGPPRSPGQSHGGVVR